MNAQKTVPRPRKVLIIAVVLVVLLAAVVLVATMIWQGQQRKAEMREIERQTPIFLDGLLGDLEETREAYEAAQQEQTPEAVQALCKELNSLSRRLLEDAPEPVRKQYTYGYSDEAGSLLLVRALISVLTDTDLGQTLTLSRLSELTEDYSGEVFTLEDFMAALRKMENRVRTLREDFGGQADMDANELERWCENAAGEIYGCLPRAYSGWDLVPDR